MPSSTSILAAIVVIGSFAYFIVRGGGDAPIVTIIAGSLGMVLSYFFAHQIANGAADKAAAKLEASRTSSALALVAAADAATLLAAKKIVSTADSVDAAGSKANS